MSVIADTHVHLYDCYDLNEFLKTAFGNLVRHGGDSTKALFFAERSGCDFFNKIKKEGLSGVQGGYRVEETASRDCIKITNESGDYLYVFAGRQVVTKERLEILGLLTGEPVQEGLPARDVINVIRENGGIPVLTWALGKWMFGRARIVRAIVEQATPGELVIGDTYMRPAGLAEAGAMKLARSRGLGILAGTDPLPFEGEEKLVGQYVSLIEGDFDSDHPVESLRSIVMSKDFSSVAAGARGSILSTVQRRLM